MTTIAFRDGWMSADRAAYSGSVINHNSNKIAVRGDGAICGCAGVSSICAAFRRWFLAGESEARPPLGTNNDDDIHAIVVRPSGRVEMHDRFGWTEIEGPFFAIGSGREIALGAMAAGATADQAVRIAARFGVGIETEIDVVELGRMGGAAQPNPSADLTRQMAGFTDPRDTPEAAEELEAFAAVIRKAKAIHGDLSDATSEDGPDCDCAVYNAPAYAPDQASADNSSGQDPIQVGMGGAAILDGGPNLDAGMNGAKEPAEVIEAEPAAEILRSDLPANATVIQDGSGQDLALLDGEPHLVLDNAPSDTGEGYGAEHEADPDRESGAGESDVTADVAGEPEAAQPAAEPEKPASGLSSLFRKLATAEAEAE